MGRKSFFAPGEAEAVRRRRADRDAFRLDAERVGEPCAHRRAVRGDPRLLADQDDVRVDEMPSVLLDAGPRLPQQLDRIGTVQA